ncbi:MAG: hypothetical protein QN172_08900 [Armatimonadota bacterium]|nr:hypothetical protein [Armatimonadota bacterium]MDR7438503.1 hypothetical protein [Armatimonadota bacterium]MDR7562311.1 hypothetical protein [Armatimonadota bacterium]MDR7567426.1 hypothetical protein [Armatimonadota bacterium]MDR7602560.1 hypothetical protein [Armatimonadota bacterium]
MRVVLWLEDTEASWQAFQYARDLAALRGVGLVVVCPEGLADRVRSEVTSAGVEVRASPEAEVVVNLLRAAEEEGGEIVVAARRTPTGKVVLGDRVTTVLLNAPGPVVVFKPPWKG